YPIRVVNFSSGSHGISLRMTDWRQVLNWMLAADGG
ncbi:MAG: alpha/beta hydrolase, partial [Hyphomicrobiales bacterium]|nr:alpha/beta hydrolase [Hyphomicrobiales bacterium]MCP4383618.1 alpha/beta hydrolase [Hyphomicrobiales bacterium]